MNPGDGRVDLRVHTAQQKFSDSYFFLHYYFYGGLFQNKSYFQALVSGPLYTLISYQGHKRVFLQHLLN